MEADRPTQLVFDSSQGPGEGNTLSKMAAGALSESCLSPPSPGFAEWSGPFLCSPAQPSPPGAFLCALKCLPPASQSWCFGGGGGAHKGPVVGQQPRQQPSPWVTQSHAISFVRLPGSLLEAEARLARGGRSSPASPLREGVARPPGRRAFHVAGGRPAGLEPYKDRGWRWRGPATCLQSRPGWNQSAALGEACVPHQARLC